MKQVQYGGNSVKKTGRLSLSEILACYVRAHQFYDRYVIGLTSVLQVLLCPSFSRPLPDGAFLLGNRATVHLPSWSPRASPNAIGSAGASLSLFCTAS